MVKIKERLKLGFFFLKESVDFEIFLGHCGGNLNRLKQKRRRKTKGQERRLVMV